MLAHKTERVRRKQTIQRHKKKKQQQQHSKIGWNLCYGSKTETQSGMQIYDNVKNTRTTVKMSTLKKVCVWAQNKGRKKERMNDWE